MSVPLLVVSLTALLGADAVFGASVPRERHPLAPSLPLLTPAEEVKIEKIIDRFIAYDTGKLKGAEGLQALKDFKGLSAAAIPCLIDGLNRAANLEHSCPASVIARKLVGFLSTSNDPELLDYARENIGAGVTAQRHQGVLRDLRLACMLRKSTLQRRMLAVGGKAGANSSALRAMPLADLVAAAGSIRGPRLKAILVELEKRNGDAVVNALGAAAGTYEEDVQQLARKLLERHLSRLDAASLKPRLKDDCTTVRAAAARVAGAKRLGGELIACLDDADAEVRQAAHQALVQLARGTDYGPEADAGPGARAAAVRQWQTWWTRMTSKR